MLAFYFYTFNIIQNNQQSHVWLIDNAIIIVYQTKNPTHHLLEMLTIGKMEFYICVFLNFDKLVFKKLKPPSTKLCVYMAQVDTPNSVNSIEKALFTILRII